MPRKSYILDPLVQPATVADGGHLASGVVIFPETKFGPEQTFNLSGITRYPLLSRPFLRAFYAYGLGRRRATRRMVYNALRWFFDFLDDYQHRRHVERPEELDRQVWLAYRAYVLRRFPAQVTAAAAYNAVARLAREVKGQAPDVFEALEIPRFGLAHRPGDTPRGVVPPDAVEGILAAARREVEAAWARFTEGQRLVAEAEQRYGPGEVAGRLSRRQLRADLGALLLLITRAYGGVVPWQTPAFNARTPHHFRLFDAIAAHGGAEHVGAYLHLTVGALVPYLVVLGLETWANGDALLEFRRTCLRPDELLPYRTRLVWDKPRAGKEQHRSYDRRKRGSVPQLIEQVLALTKPLVPHATPREQEALFLVRGRAAVGIPRKLGQSPLHLELDAFMRRNGLAGPAGRASLRLRDLRPAAMRAALQQGRAFQAIRALAGHASPATTARYLAEHLREQADAAIATAQDVLFQVPAEVDGQADASLAERPGLTCVDPTNGRGPGAVPGQLCPNWLVELLNPALIIPGEPRYIARLLQAEAQLRAAQDAITARRFTLLYRPHFEAVVDALRHFDDPALLKAARSLVPALPPLPRLDVA